jgi:uncharacterized protein YceK
MNLSDRQRLRIIEQWTGHRRPPHTKPPNRMKSAFYALLLLVIALAIFGLSACATVTTRTTTTDPKSGLVTVTETTTSAPDTASVNALAGTAAAFAPRAVVIDTGGK